MIFVKIRDESIPALGFGTWKLGGGDCVAAVGKALETGYRHIDTAQIYENEAEVGKAIEASPVPREDIFLTTKVWMDKVQPGKLQQSVQDSLGRLRTDYTDLLLIHWPVAQVPLADTIGALLEVQKQGKTRHIGVSNFTVALMKEADKLSDGAMLTNQVEYHPYLDQAPVMDFLRAHDMFLTAYSPLARGKVGDDRLISEIARKYRKTSGQVTLRWLLQQGFVSAIPKAGSEKHIRENFEIFDFELSAEDMKAISGLGSDKGRMVNPEWSPQWDRAKAA